MKVVTDKDGGAYTTIGQIGLPIALKLAEGLQAIVDWEVDARLSTFGLMLVEIFDVSYARACRATKVFTLEEFSKNLEQLETIVSPKNAALIVKNSKFLEYSNSTLESYLKLAIVAAHKLSNITADNVPLFYSITSLAEVVEPKQQVCCGELRQFNVRQYMFLHSDNEQSVRYINDLIETCVLQVGREEHWCKSENCGGARGRDILKRIKRDLTHIFSDAGLSEPECRINHGQHKLIISEETRQNLRKVVDFLKTQGSYS